ncbi:hypothetical protein IJ182_08835 [bacterium]|nr:hypothetical protein [bacterium]
MKNIILSLVILIAVIAGISFVLLFNYIYDDKDACLDSGVCNEGLTLRMNDGKEIIINKDTCIQYNGEWREKRRDCILRD